jgi:HEAT repeat protein/putative zinc finger protein
MQGESIMTCSQAKELIAAAWLGELENSQQPMFRQHLETCAECSAEMVALDGLWARLGDMPAPEPGPSLEARWQSTLESLVSSAQTSRKPFSRALSLANFWPRSPVWQAAVALACLVIGLLIGTNMPRQSKEIAKLHEEIANTREMVALSLLQQQSATERIRGVNYTGRMQTMEPEMVSALMDAIAHDQSVNVRLAAIDALSKASGNPGVLQSLTKSLPGQDSPMVQAALIDYLVDARDRKAIGTLRQFAAQPDLNPAVLERARFAVQQLSR